MAYYDPYTTWVLCNPLFSLQLNKLLAIDHKTYISTTTKKNIPIFTCKRSFSCGLDAFFAIICIKTYGCLEILLPDHTHLMTHHDAVFHKVREPASFLSKACSPQAAFHPIQMIFMSVSLLLQKWVFDWLSN